MKALLWIYYILCLVCYYYAVPQTQKNILSLSSLIPRIPTLDDSIDIPWLVSMPGNCQGIVLSQWLILSTANCLKKIKLSHLDISGVNYPESISREPTVCLHPRFDPQDEKSPAKADIGLVLLEEPISADDIPLSKAPNITLKSCSNCQYTSCYVYEYESSKKLGITKVKKKSVQLLDLSTCHHQHSYLEKNEGLCIQSQLQQDCWIQQASPVLCLLKDHWELVGLTHMTSRICNNPAVIIRTAPYFSWMKRFVKASKKLVDPSAYLLCSTSHEREYVPQIRHSQNYPSTQSLPQSSVTLLEGNLGISPQPKLIKHFPTIARFSSVDSFTDSNKLFFDRGQTFQASKFLDEQIRTPPVVRLLENPTDNLFQYPQGRPLPTMDNSKDSLPPSTAKPHLTQLTSDTTISYTSLKTDTTKPWGFPVDNIEESFDKIMANIVKQWSPSTHDSTEPLNSPKASTSATWAKSHITKISSIGTTANIDEYMNSMRAYTVAPYNHPSTVTGTSSNLALSDIEGPWRFFTSAENVNTTTASLDSVEQSKTPDTTWLPLPSSTIEPWSSSHEYYALIPQDQPITDAGRFQPITGAGRFQPITDSGKSQNNPISGIDRLQILPIAEMGVLSTPSKMVTYAPHPANFEAKFIPYQAKYNTIPSQGLSSFRADIQPTDDVGP